MGETGIIDVATPSIENEQIVDFDVEGAFTGEVLRIEENVYRSWTGVRSCCDSQRAQAEFQSGLEGWVSQKLLEHINMKVIRYGALPVNPGCSNSGGGGWPDTTPRRCRGWVTLACYIEFAK